MPSRWTRFDMLEHQCTESPCLAGRRVCCSESKSEGRSQAWSGEERGVVWSSVVWCRCRWSCCLLIVVFGLVLGPAHGTGRCYQHPLAGHAGFTSACFHSRPSTPVINSCYLPVQSRADHLCLPRSLALIVIFASLGQPTAAPFTGNPLFITVYASSSNHHNHSPPIVGCPCTAFPTNQSPRRHVSASRQPRPLLQPPPFEGTVDFVKPPEAIRHPPVAAIRSLTRAWHLALLCTDARACRRIKKTTTLYKMAACYCNPVAGLSLISFRCLCSTSSHLLSCATSAGDAADNGPLQ